MSAGDRLRISGAGLEAEIAPSLGGRLTSLRQAGRDILVPLPEGRFDALFWSKGGAYPLVPFHNRIEGARLSFAGEVFELLAHPDAAPHSLHGPAQRRPWRLAGRDETSVALALSYAADADWPWRFEATQRFVLGSDGLTVALALRNTGAGRMPAGLGWHPYFPAGEVDTDARLRWPHASDYLPTGERLTAAAPQSGSTPYFEAWSAATIRLEGMDVTLTASADFVHLVVHRADRYVCLEPATHVANGFNLAARGHAHTGMRILAPGETMAGTIRLAIRQSAAQSVRDGTSLWTSAM